MKAKLFYVIAGLLVVSMLFITLGSLVSMPATAALEQPFKGTKLRIATTDALPALAAQHELLDEDYRTKSGVDLIVDILPFNDLYSKLQTMCQAGSDDYDAMWLDGPWYGAFVQAGCIEDLATLVKEQSDPAELALDDYPLRTVAYQGIYDSKLYVLPEFHAVGMLSYRSDLFEDPNEQAAYKAQYGQDLKVPETWEEYLQVGKFFTRPEKQLWGLNHRYGSGNNIVADLLIGFAYSRGATLFDKDFNPTFNTPEFKDAASFFLSKELLSVQPPGAESFSFAEVMQNMMQGKVAMYVTENWAIPNLKDPRISPHAEHIKFAKIAGWKNPQTGEIVRGTMVGAGGFAINAHSKNKAAAFDYIQFMTNKSNAKLIADKLGWAIRTSAYTDPEFVERYPYFTVNLEQVKVSVARPSEPWWAEVEFTVGKELQEALLGHQTVDQALVNADTKVREILDKAGYYATPHRYLDPTEKEADACQVLAGLGVKHPECK